MVGKVDIVVDVVDVVGVVDVVDVVDVEDVVETYLKPSPGVVLLTQGNVLLIQNMVRRT